MDLALEQALQGSGHSTKSARAQAKFGQCSQVQDVIVGAVLYRDRTWSSMTLVDLFQSRILYNFMIL